MTIHIMSRTNAKKYSEEKHAMESAVISISDCDKDSPTLKSNLNNGIIAHCKLKFNDVDRGEINCITEADALKIVSFVTENKDRIDKLIVHCEAGRSRSAGVAAAIMKALTGSDWDVFDNPRYIPNMTCYRVVLNAFNQLLV